MGVLAARDAHHDTIPRLNQVEIGNRFAYLPAESLAQFVELEAALALIASPSLLSRLVTNCCHALSRRHLISLTAQMPLLIDSPEAASCNIPLLSHHSGRHRGSSPRQRTLQVLAGTSSPRPHSPHYRMRLSQCAEDRNPPLTRKTAPHKDRGYRHPADCADLSFRSSDTTIPTA